MNNDQNKGVTGVAKTGTGILGNTVSGVSNTLGGVVGKFPSIFLYLFFPLNPLPRPSVSVNREAAVNCRADYVAPTACFAAGCSLRFLLFSQLLHSTFGRLHAALSSPINILDIGQRTMLLTG